MEIHIDPSLEPRRVLLALAAMLTTLANDHVETKIARADSPDAGTETKPLNRLQTLAGVTPPVPVAGADLAAAFGGAGNGAALSGTAPFPPPASTVAASPSIPTPTLAPAADSPAPDLAAAFGGSSNGPNVAPLTPPAGMPPAPPSGVPTAGASSQVELDADGLPWNAEIHSSNQKKAATGKWMARRNVSDATLERVTAQLRAALAVGNVPAPAATAPPPPPPGAIPSPPPLVGTTTATAGSSGVTMAALLPRITSAISSGELTAESAQAIALEISDGKINNVAMLAIAPQLVPVFWQRLDVLGVAQ